MAEEIDGIFHEVKQIEAGTMGTARKHATTHELHYYCKSDGDEIVLYFLKPDGTKTAMEMNRISKETFYADFKPTPAERFEQKSEEQKKKEDAEAKVSTAEKHLEKEEYHAAAFEFGQAIKQDSKNLKAHLGKGKAHMELGETDKAKESFDKLSEIDELYTEENKHIFNEYGIELRRGKMYDTAIENYKKAISIDANDSALYFNISRAYLEKGEKEEGLINLRKALELKPDFKEAKMLFLATTKGKE